MSKDYPPPIPREEEPKTQTGVTRQGPPWGVRIASGVFDLRRFSLRGGPTTYLEIHEYEEPPHEFTENKILAYISTKKRFIHNYTGAREGIERTFENKSPSEVYENFKRALDIAQIPYTDHGLMKKVYIYSFSDVKVNNLVRIIYSI